MAQTLKHDVIYDDERKHVSTPCSYLVGGVGVINNVSTRAGWATH